MRESFPGTIGKVAVDVGPSTGHRIRCNLILPTVNRPIPCLPAQRAVAGWAWRLREAGALVLELHGSVPLRWNGDLMDGLPADDLRDLIGYIAEVAFGEPGDLRHRDRLNLVLTSDIDSSDTMVASGGLPATTTADQDRAFEITSVCHIWQRTHREWLLQHVQRVRLLLRVPNHALTGGQASVKSVGS